MVIEPSPLDLPSSVSLSQDGATTSMETASVISQSMMSSSSDGSFLGPKVPTSAATASTGPEEVDLPRVAPTGDTTIITVSTEKSKKPKSNRQSDVETDSPPLPGMRDLLTGLLNVVGEGLTLATNFVKEENERKKAASEAAGEESIDATATTTISAVPAILKPGRVNNRGPPRFTEIPFEAIPLEILSTQRPGQKPVQIPQRPFTTRIKVTRTKLVNGIPPPFATGVPLPEILIPGITAAAATTPSSAEVEADEAVTDESAVKFGTTLSSFTGTNQKPEVNRPSTKDPSVTNIFYHTTPREPPSYTPKPVTLKNEVLIKLQNNYLKPRKNLTKDDTNDKLLPNRENDIINMKPKPSGSRPSGKPAVQVGPIMINPVTQKTRPLLGPQRRPSSEPPVKPPVKLPPLPRPNPRPPSPPPPPPPRRPSPQRPRQPQPSNNIRKKPPVKKTPPLRQPPYLTSPEANNGIIVDPPRPPLGLVPGQAFDIRRPTQPSKGDIFDLTVTAQQNFGGNSPGKPQPLNPGISFKFFVPSFCHLQTICYHFADIITRASPGDQFVSIDGKRTYFNVGPTRMPPNLGSIDQLQAPGWNGAKPPSTKKYEYSF